MITNSVKMTKKYFLGRQSFIFYESTYLFHSEDGQDCYLIFWLVEMTISTHQTSWRVMVGWGDRFSNKVFSAWFLSSRWLVQIGWSVFLYEVDNRSIVICWDDHLSVNWPLKLLDQLRLKTDPHFSLGRTMGNTWFFCE